MNALTKSYCEYPITLGSWAIKTNAHVASITDEPDLISNVNVHNLPVRSYRIIP